VEHADFPRSFSHNYGKDVFAGAGKPEGARVVPGFTDGLRPGFVPADALLRLPILNG